MPSGGGHGIEATTGRVAGLHLHVPWRPARCSVRALPSAAATGAPAAAGKRRAMPRGPGLM
jgi:hypothetical protein